MMLHQNQVCIVSSGDDSPGICAGIAWGKAQQSEHTNEQSTKLTSANSAALHPDRA